MKDVPEILRLWYRLLKPGGRVGFDAPAHNSWAPWSALAAVAKRHGISLRYTRLETEEACRDVLTETGFEALKVSTERFDSRFMPLTEVNAAWDRNTKHPLSRPFLSLPTIELAQIKSQFITELVNMATVEGVRDETIIHIAFGRKPDQ